MSTFIKVSGGQSALLQANQAQAAANRQAALERMSREKAGQQGKRERDTRRKPLYGVPTPARARKEEPAAFLATKYYEALLQPSDIIDADNELRFSVQVKGGTSFSALTQKTLNAGDSEFGFTGSGLVYYDNLTIDSADIIERLPTGGPTATQPALRFKKWPAILNSGIYKKRINYRLEIDDSAGAIARKPAGKKPPGDFTIELYLQLSENAVSPGDAYSGFRQINFELRNPATDQLFTEIVIYTENDPNSGNNCIAIYGWLDNDGIEQQATDIVVNNAHQWHHYAICRKAGQVSAYLDGARVSGPHATTYAATADGLDLYLSCKADQTVDYGTAGLPLYTPDAARISNVLFSTKALYDGPFTPVYFTP